MKETNDKKVMKRGNLDITTSLPKPRIIRFSPGPGYKSFRTTDIEIEMKKKIASQKAGN